MCGAAGGLRVISWVCVGLEHPCVCVYGFVGRVDVGIVGRMDVLRSKEKCNDVRM